MKDKYIDLIEQSFDFPQDEFTVEDNELNFHDIPLMELIKQYGTPLKITYLPKISQQINRAKRMFNVAMAKVDYKGSYNYCYCTKSSHFSFVLEEAMKNDIHLETSSAYDIHIINALYDGGIIDKDRYIICNGFKRPQYVENIAQLVNDGFSNTIPVLDNKEELELFEDAFTKKCKVGIRIACEEEPKFDFYTSRLGIRYNDIVDFYKAKLKNSKKFQLKMLHFFINTGIKDTAYYWNELSKCMNVYCELKTVCPELDSLNIGGGFPIKNSLNFEYDYEYLHRRDRGADQEHLPAQRRRGAQHLHRIRIVHRGRKRRGALLDRQPEAAERPRELVHDRLVVHHHPARHVGHQPALHHAGREQLGQGVPARAAGRD